ncbi:MAG: hypothetical protein B6D35_09660, partial [Candidatus Brocadia sp. UTAMX2]
HFRHILPFYPKKFNDFHEHFSPASPYFTGLWGVSVQTLSKKVVFAERGEKQITKNHLIIITLAYKMELYFIFFIVTGVINSIKREIWSRVLGSEGIKRRFISS